MSTAENKQHAAPASSSKMPEALAAGHGHRCAGSSIGNIGTLATCKVSEDAVTDQTAAGVVRCRGNTYCPDSSTPPLQLWAGVRPGHINAAAQPAGPLITTTRLAAEGGACPGPKQPLSWRQQLIQPLYPELRPASAQGRPGTSKSDQAQTLIQAHKRSAEGIPAFRGAAPHQCSASTEAAADGCAGAKLPRGRAWAAELYEGLQAKDCFKSGTSGPPSGASGTMSPPQRQSAAAVADAKATQKKGSPGLAQCIQLNVKQARSSKGKGSTQRPKGLSRPPRLSRQQKENCHTAGPGSQLQAATQRGAAGSAPRVPSAADRAKACCKEALSQQHSARLSSPRHHPAMPRSATHSPYPDLLRGIAGAHVSP